MLTSVLPLPEQKYTDDRFTTFLLLLQMQSSQSSPLCLYQKTCFCLLLLSDSIPNGSQTATPPAFHSPIHLIISASNKHQQVFTWNKILEPIRERSKSTEEIDHAFLSLKFHSPLISLALQQNTCCSLPLYHPRL